MADSSSIAEAQTFKSQLKEILSRKFIDQSLLLGFNSVIQSKFQAWILNDFSLYFNGIENGKQAPNNQLGDDFNTINYLESLWADFHYPVIKFFQSHHGALFNEVSRDYQNSRSNDYRTGTKKDGSNRNKNEKGNKKNFNNDDSFKGFKVKPVEIRKINDNFNKFIKQVYQYYHNLLKHFATEYHNPLLPKSVLEFFNFKVSPTAIATSNNDVQANILYLIHKCLLCLGDISRHRTYIETFYVKPLVSNKDFFKFSQLAEKEKSIELKPAFEKTIQYYQLCILILPALNEPYNHIGMVYNSVDDRIKSCYWFLRSQFTRIPDFRLGLDNLNHIVGKKWLLTKLVDIIEVGDSTPKRGRFSYNTAEEMDIVLMNLIGYFYMPSVFKVGPNIVKKLTFSKIEGHFFKTLSNSFIELLNNDEEEDEFGTFFIKQLTVLFSFNKLMAQSPDLGTSANPSSKEELLSKFSGFTFRYIETVFKGLQKLDLANASLKNPLTILRFILNWVNENKVVLRQFQSRSFTIQHLATNLNNILVYLKNNEKPTLEVLRELVQSKIKPVRGYYFKEDVLFRDFSIIKYQFKDFNDSHLFKSNNSDLLVGNYTPYFEENGIPTFLDNEVCAQLQEVFSSETSSNGISFKLLVKKEIRNYENNLRLAAVIVLGSKLLDKYFVTESTSFKYTGGTIAANSEDNTVEISDSQGFGEKLSKMKGKKTKKRLVGSRKVSPSQSPSYAQIAGGLNPSKSSLRELDSPQELQSKPDTPMEDVILKESRVDCENTVDESKQTTGPETSQSKIPSSIEEIESTILNYTSQLENSLKYSGEISVSSTADLGVSENAQGDGLRGMVDTLVQDPKEPDQIATTQYIGSNTWRDPQPSASQHSLNFNNTFKSPAPANLGFSDGTAQSRNTLAPTSHHMNPQSVGTPFSPNGPQFGGFQHSQFPSQPFTPFVPYNSQPPPNNHVDAGSTPFNYYNSQPVFGGPDYGHGQQGFHNLSYPNADSHQVSNQLPPATHFNPYPQYGGAFNPMYPQSQFLQGTPTVRNTELPPSQVNAGEKEPARYTQNNNPYPQYFNS